MLLAMKVTRRPEMPGSIQRKVRKDYKIRTQLHERMVDNFRPTSTFAQTGMG